MARDLCQGTDSGGAHRSRGWAASSARARRRSYQGRMPWMCPLGTKPALLRRWRGVRPYREAPRGSVTRPRVTTLVGRTTPSVPAARTQPCLQASRGDSAGSVARKLLQYPGSEAIGYLSFTAAGEACNLIERDRLGLHCWQRSSLAGEPARLDRRAGDEPGPGGVGLGVDFKLAPSGRGARRC
jgi:hypothetical protein